MLNFLNSSSDRYGFLQSNFFVINLKKDADFAQTFRTERINNWVVFFDKNHLDIVDVGVDRNVILRQAVIYKKSEIFGQRLILRAGLDWLLKQPRIKFVNASFSDLSRARQNDILEYTLFKAFHKFVFQFFQSPSDARNPAANQHQAVEISAKDLWFVRTHLSALRSDSHSLIFGKHKKCY